MFPHINLYGNVFLLYHKIVAVWVFYDFFFFVLVFVEAKNVCLLSNPKIIMYFWVGFYVYFMQMLKIICQIISVSFSRQAKKANDANDNLFFINDFIAATKILKTMNEFKKSF